MLLILQCELGYQLFVSFVTFSDRCILILGYLITKLRDQCIILSRGSRWSLINYYLSISILVGVEFLHQLIDFRRTRFDLIEGNHRYLLIATCERNAREDFLSVSQSFLFIRAILNRTFISIDDPLNFLLRSFVRDDEDGDDFFGFVSDVPVNLLD